MALSSNPEKNSALIWAVAAAGSLVLAFVLAAVGFGGSSASFGRFFPPLALVVFSLLGALIFAALFWSALKLDSMMSGDNVLARWDYEAGQVDSYALAEQGRKDKVKLVSLFFIALMCGMGVLFGYGKDGWDALAVIENVFLFAISVAFLYVVAPALGYGPANSTKFVLTADGALFAGRFHFWRVFMSRLEKVNFAAGKPSLIRIAYSVPSQNGSHPISLEIPVPKGKDAEAKSAVEKIREKELPKEKMMKLQSVLGRRK